MRDVYQCGQCKQWFYDEEMNHIHNGGNKLPELICSICIVKVLQQWELKLT
jgi:hypothetical protein